MITPFFASTQEILTFRAGSISECLRAAADWLEQEGLHCDENVTYVEIDYHEKEDDYGVTIPGRCVVGKQLISNPKTQ
jgi:hypothetical protein